MTTPNSPEAEADAASSSAATPYGTRSRGRNAPRPNYAEDHDVDMEIEMNAPASKMAKRNSGVALNSIVNGSKSESEKPSPVHPRKSLTNGTNGKEAIPGTSSFSARPDDVNGINSLRKRKHAASTSNSSLNPGSASSTKRIFTSAPDADGGYYTNMVSFEGHGPYLIDEKLQADDGTTYAINDHVYLVCEPPGEAYYLARIMEFVPSKTKPDGFIEAIRVNWYYRPRDIQRHSADPRVVYASMHSDTCPLASLRGKCEIRHVSQISNPVEFKRSRDSFWYEKMFDRYIHRFYDVIPTKDVINVPSKVKRVLDDRWKYILVETGRAKEFTGAVKTCTKCNLFAANSESVDCAVCRSTYHMQCVRPVLTKKPARGFAWACAPCSRAQERKLAARNTPIIGEKRHEGEDEVMEEEEEEAHLIPAVNGTGVSTPAAEDDLMPLPATAEQIAQAKMWPYRYLGVHCRVEDALDYDDRIYPRASSRLGPRHQAIVPAWPGRPVEYVKAIDLKRKYAKVNAGKKDSKPSKETQSAMESAKQEKATRPKWVQDEPPGYIPRGEDEPVTVNGKQVRTAELMFKMPTADQIPRREDDGPVAFETQEAREKFIDDYMAQAKKLAPDIGVPEYSTNFLDKALELLYSNSFDSQAALARLKKANKYKDLKEPHLRPEEVKLFEQGVTKYGSEWRNITKHVGSVPHRQIVRFYYMWKKTPRGKQIWGSYEGRRGKKDIRRASTTSKLVDDVADDHDDSAFDSEKAVTLKLGFQCKFCNTRSSRQWRRAPGVPPGTTVVSDPSSKKDKGPALTVSLCLQCALMWRKYAIQWEDVDEVGKRIATSGNKSWRRRIDEEIFTQLIMATETPFVITAATAAVAASLNIPLDNPVLQLEGKLDAAKRKMRTDKDSTATSTATSVEPMPKKAKGTDLPIVPDPPKAKTLSCAVCNRVEPTTGDQHLSCRDCRLTVHRNCYGIQDSRPNNKWLCDMCSNDRSPSISTTYECVLCPVSWTEHDLMETSKNTSRKKSDRDKEKERLEKEMVSEAIKLYRQRQEAVGKPVGPREPLKRTAGNNWAHVLCSLWTPELKYGDAKELEPAEGFGFIPKDRWREVCKICKSNKGACVPCHFTGCNAHFHVGCAFQAQYRIGFDVTPVKSSRRDSVQTIRLGGEVGAAVPAIYCPHHAVTTVVHEIGEPTGQDGLNALQLFARTYKQADLTLTGTVRRAAYIQQSVAAPPHHGGHRRGSTSNGVAAAKDKIQPTPSENAPDEMDIDTDDHVAPRIVSGVETSRKCVRCSSEFSPRWWPYGRRFESRPSLTNGVGSSFHSRHPPQPFGQPGDGEQAYECHKCHLKHPPEPSPDPRPSPYAAQRPPMLPTPRMPGHTFVAHTHSGPNNSMIGRSPSSYSGGYEQRPGGDNRRNGMSPSAYPSASPAPSHHYQTPHPAGPPPPSHYPSTGPPPLQSYSTHQSPYGPMSARSPHLSQAAPAPRPYAASASPPVVQATPVNRSPQNSLSALNGGPPQRMYSGDRVLGAPSHSPPVTQARLADPRGPTPPNRPDDRPSLSASRPSGMNGAGSGSGGASASPSLKNLLS